MLGLIPDELKEELKIKTGGLLKENTNEIQIFCPYCDDAYRKPNPRHGHLYIGKNNLLFICHRCQTKGHLFKLLRDLQIPPEKYFKKSDLKKLKIFSFSNFKIFNSQQNIENKNLDFLNQKIKIGKNYFPVNKNFVIKKIFSGTKFLDSFEYVYSRTHINDLNKIFTLNFSPWKNSILFFNSRNFLFQIRFLKKLKLRYMFVLNKILNFSELLPTEKYFGYFLNFENYIGENSPCLVIAEGPFDIINIFRKNRDKYSGDFVSIRGAFYQKVIEELLFFRQNYKKIVLYLDSDINEKKLIFRLEFTFKKIFDFYKTHFGPNYSVEFLNKKIILIKNPIFKDYGEISRYAEKIIFESKLSDLIYI